MAGNNKKDNKKHALSECLRDPNYLETMDQFAFQRAIPQIVRDLVNKKIDLGKFGQFLLTPRVFNMLSSQLAYLYQYNSIQYNALMQYQSAMQQSGQQYNVQMLQQMITSTAANTQVYWNTYCGLCNYQQTGNYMMLIAPLANDQPFARYLNSPDRTGEIAIEREEKKQIREQRINRNSFNNGNRKERRYSNDNRRNKDVRRCMGQEQSSIQNSNGQWGTV